LSERALLTGGDSPDVARHAISAVLVGDLFAKTLVCRRAELDNLVPLALQPVESPVANIRRSAHPKIGTTKRI
jgi:hypothetical protein